MTRDRPQVADDPRVARGQMRRDRPLAADDPRVARGIAAAVQRWRLPAGSAEPLTALLELLVHDDNAPTAVRDPLRAIDDHLSDSLVALELPAVRSARRIVDLGSGAGLPGLSLAIALPTSDVTLLESSARKCAFIQRAIAASGVGNATTVHARAEEWSAGLGRCDLVTARAVAPLAVLAEYAAPLLSAGGALVAWRGRRDAVAERRAEAAATELGLEVAEPIRVSPYSRARDRHLHVIRKVSETPARFPRRAGVAIKRPLGEPAPGKPNNPPSDRRHR